jgi:two-component system, NarL family, nitrate/nitrite response regulator NarL
MAATLEQRGVRFVLIVDDNPMVRKAVCDAFTREENLKICGVAENGRDAIEKAQMLHPALIIMDLSMPVLNGLEATRKLKKLMPAVPVILYSIHSARSLQTAASAAGAAAVVSKSDAITVLIDKARQLTQPMAA